MAIPNYKDLLDLTGLESWQFMIIVLIVLALWPIVTILWKTGAVNQIQVDLVQLASFQCVYISYLGSYNDIGKIYSQSVEDFRMVFKLSNFFAVFYDKPNQQQEVMSKAVIGLTVHALEKGKVDLFLAKFPQYKKGDLPTSSCLLSTLPLLSISPILAIGRVYPQIDLKIKELNLHLKYNQILEIYHQNDSEQSMSVIVPISNEEKYQLWYQPTAYSTISPKKME